MTVNTDKHAYIDLEVEEVENLRKTLSFLETLNDTIKRLEKENTSWDIRSDIDEGEVIDLINDINFSAHNFMFD